MEKAKADASSAPATSSQPPAAPARVVKVPTRSPTPKEKTPKKLFETLHEKMPSLFTRDEEKQYDTYAACLAATESLRRMRDNKFKNKKELSAVDVEDKSWKSILNPSDSGGDKGDEHTAEEEYKRACAEYVLNSSKAINALGLSVTQFNQLGREVSKDKSLKEKVRDLRFGL
jgi:hypothetical protein